MAELDATGRGARARSLDAALLSPMRVGPTAAVLVLAAAMGLTWGINYLAGGAGVFPPHLFYLPVFLAGARFGVSGALAAALAATFVAGPLLPLHVGDGTAQAASDWGGRGGFFVVIGVAVTASVVRLQRALAAEHKVVELEHELAESKALIVQSVSHEFRTPLTVIKGTSDTLVEYINEPGLAQLVEGLRRSVQRLEGLVETVLAAADALGDITAWGRAEVDLAAMCTGLAGRLRLAERIRVHGSPGVTPLPVDHRLLQVALRSVLEGAVRASPEDAVVDVHVQAHERAVEVRVVDRGEVADDLPSLFQPFSEAEARAGSHGERLGLGLFAAKVVVERAGGSVLARRLSPSGKEVSLVIPRA